MSSKTGGFAALVLGALALASAPVTGQESGDNTFANAVSGGDFNLGLRYRYEYVNDDNPGLADDTANASTIRLRMNFRTGAYRNFTAFAEFDYIAEVLLDDFNSLGGSSPPRNAYPVVADPKGPDLNQLYLDYDPSQYTRIRVGRQRINFDNQRFVGGVGWRQNEQTFDSVSLDLEAGGNTEFQYAYVSTVRRIFGDDVPAGRHDVDAHLLNARIDLGDELQVVPYYYYIDNEDAAGASTGTFGVRATGTMALGEGNLALVGEFASQTDVANNPVSFDTNYFNVGVTWTLPTTLTFGLAYEALGGDAAVAGSAFRTPLATLHPFQGWADKFLTTPDEGIEDLYATVRYKAGKWSLAGVYHDFSAEDSSADWGTEFDFSAGRALGNGYSLLLKAALYDADQHAADTTKFWIMLTGSY